MKNFVFILVLLAVEIGLLVICIIKKAYLQVRSERITANRINSKFIRMYLNQMNQYKFLNFCLLLFITSVMPACKNKQAEAAIEKKDTISCMKVPARFASTDSDKINILYKFTTKSITNYPF